VAETESAKDPTDVFDENGVALIATERPDELERTSVARAAAFREVIADEPREITIDFNPSGNRSRSWTCKAQAQMSSVDRA
jgi:hypothetical protein